MRPETLTGSWRGVATRRRARGAAPACARPTTGATCTCLAAAMARRACGTWHALTWRRASGARHAAFRVRSFRFGPRSATARAACGTRHASTWGLASGARHVGFRVRCLNLRQRAQPAGHCMLQLGGRPVEPGMRLSLSPPSCVPVVCLRQPRVISLALPFMSEMGPLQTWGHALRAGFACRRRGTGAARGPLCIHPIALPAGCRWHAAAAQWRAAPARRPACTPTSGFGVGYGSSCPIAYCVCSVACMYASSCHSCVPSCEHTFALGSFACELHQLCKQAHYRATQSMSRHSITGRTRAAGSGRVRKRKKKTPQNTA